MTVPDVQGEATAPRLTRVLPTEQRQLVLEFASGEIRALDLSGIGRLDGPGSIVERDRPEYDWSALAFPEAFRHLAFDDAGIRWDGGQELDAGSLYTLSRPLSGAELSEQSFRVAYRNQAPTPDDPSHHVYYVYLRPFDAKPYRVGESIHGGHGERGGETALDGPGLRAWPGWREHFELAGCGWAVPLVDAAPCDGSDPALDAIVGETCRRADTEESDVATYEAKRATTRT